MTRTKASIEQNTNLGIQLWSKGVNAEDALAYLKQHKYTINNIVYNGIVVAQTVATINRIDSGIRSGKLGAAKKSGLQIKS